MKYLLPTVTVVAAVSLLGAGCNPFQSAQDKLGQAAVESAVDQASGGQVKADVSNNQTVFKDNKTGDMMAFGEDVKLPDDFPKDVPIYAGAKVIGVTVSKQVDRGTSLSLRSTDDMQTVASWYADQLKSAGFTEDTSVSAGDTEIRSYSKDAIKMSLTVTPDTDQQDGKGSLITVIRTEEASSTDASN